MLATTVGNLDEKDSIQWNSKKQGFSTPAKREITAGMVAHPTKGESAVQDGFPQTVKLPEISQ